MEHKFKVGDRIRHADGSVGTVTSDQDRFGIVHWKSCGQYHFSSASILTKLDPNSQFRWRKSRDIES